MQRSQGLLTSYYLLLCLLAFSISLPFIFASVAIALVAIAWLAQFNGGVILQRFKERKLVWLWLIFFLQFSLSYFYSTNKDLSLIDIQRKFSFLILPVVIGLGPGLPRKWLTHIFTSFVSGIALVALLCMGRGLIHYSVTGNTDMLFYHPLVTGTGINAVYYSSYVIFVLGILLLYKFETGILRHTWLRYFIQVTCLIFFVLLSSKSLLVVFAVFVLPLSIFKRKNMGLITPRKLALIAVITVAAIVTILVTDNPIRSRYEEIFVNNTIIPEETTHKGEHQVFNNLSLRLFLWKMAWNNINEHNLWLKGCGNGDVGTLQKERIATYDSHTQALSKQPDLSVLNLHNMYLQVLMTLGIPGLIVFLLIIFLPLQMLRSIPDHKDIWLVFLVTYALFMMQESTLQTQAGVVYFTFFSQLYLLVSHRQSERGTKRYVMPPVS